jgi:dimethylhistidine N-methyltransferase
MAYDTLIAETAEDRALLDHALAGLTAPRKMLSSKYLYDAEGSRLFEAICDLPEYHVTRTEMALLMQVAPALADAIPAGAALVEFGSGASVKTRLLLDIAPQLSAYVPIDISDSALAEAAEAIAASYPLIEVAPLAEDFTRALHLPDSTVGLPGVGFFPGSTIGNFAPADAEAFLRSARTLLGSDARLILGADLTRSEALLVPAYDDAAGVTAAFNLNLLVRLNRECGADFDLSAFAHRAVWNAAEGRVEMHLVSLREQTVLLSGRAIVFTKGETIHTENSHKYRPEALSGIAARAGWRVAEHWIGHDPQGADRADRASFGIFLLEA